MKKKMFDVIIIGAGFSGLYQLYLLKKNLNLNCHLFEKAPELGGTWYWNKYPGARCDTESKAYCYFFDKKIYNKWDWSERYPSQPEIQKYLKFVAKEFNLCENIRFYPEEELNDLIFAEKLSNLGDIYVNDAFSCCHRAHSSTHSITNFMPSYFGPMLCEEISALNRTLENPSKPSLAIIGGSKVSTKISVLKNLVSKMDSIIIGGGMANTFLFAKGAPMGNSLYEPDLKDTANEILTFSKQNNCNILLPIDIITARKLEQNTKTNTSNYDECPADQMILDVGQKSIELFKQAINSSKTILWNGPLGYFENPNFEKIQLYLML